MTPERYVKKAVEDLLKAERIRYWRMNAGDRFGSSNGRKWRIRGHEKGTPDLLAAPMTRQEYKEGECGLKERIFLHIPVFLWIECKATSGKLTAEQLLFADQARNNDEVWLLVDDVKILQDWLKENRAR